MDEEKLTNEIKAISELAKGDKKIDVAALMINALEKHQANLLPSKEKNWAYLISLAVPPFGLLFALKYFFSDKDDAKQAAWICIVLTGLSLIIGIVFFKVLLSGSGTSVDQINQIKPQDIKDLYQ